MDRVPSEYILNRYCKDAHTKATFDRTDYLTMATDGSSFLYKHNECLQLAYKLLRVCSKSEERLEIAKYGLNELIEKAEAVDSTTAGYDKTKENHGIGRAHV